MNKLCKFAAACAAVLCAFGARAELPDAFVEYVESDGSAYYDTGIVASPANTKMWVVLAPTSLPTTDCSVFGARSSATDAGSDAAYVYYTGKNFRADWVGAKTKTGEISANQVYRFYCAKNTVQINEASTTGTRAKNAENSATIYLFAANNNGSVLKSGLPQKLYGARISADGVNLSADYLPCVKNDADGNPVAALYNRVTGEICYPTKGTLTAGPRLGKAGVKTFVGSVGDDWATADNWLPVGVPVETDDVIVPGGRFAMAAQSIALKSLLVEEGATLCVGSTMINNWAVANILPLAMEKSSLFVSVTGNLTVKGRFALAALRSPVDSLSMTVGGNLVFAATARANLFSGTMNCSKEDYGFARLYASAAQVMVGGIFEVTDSAKLSVFCDPKTGKAIRFGCQDFEVAASASVSARNGGWNWIKYRDDNIADYVGEEVDPRSHTSGAAYTSKRYYYILTPYHIGNWDYSNSACYGGGASPYGYPYAPFLAGSPTSCRSEPVAGGGVVWVVAKGTMTIEGLVTAHGEASQYSGCSGGGIWLCAKKVTEGCAGVLNAEGSNNSNSSSPGGGSGGRISIGVGLSDEDIDYLASGGDPAERGLSAQDGCILLTCTVQGGTGGQKNAAGEKIRGASGTVTTVYGASSDVSVTVVGSPSDMGAVDPDYGTRSYERNSTQTFTANAVAYAQEDIRYSCTGWSAVNEDGVIASGSTTTAEFSIGEKPATLTWLWGDCEKGLVVNVPENVQVKVDDVVFSESGITWGRDGDDVAFEALPAEGYEFLCWEGEVPYGKSTSNPLVLAIADMRKVTPVVRAVSEPVTRTWLGAAKTVKLWNDPANWEPAGVPGAADDVVIANGTCLVSNYAACASLKLAGGAALKVAETASSMLEEAVLVVNGDLMMTNTATLTVAPRNQYRHGRLSVGGDLVLNGTNTLTVSAGPVDGTTFTHENGCGFVTVGGNLIVGGKSTVIPNSEPWTGGSVVFTVGGNFTLTTNAAFKANDNGFQRTSGRDPITLGPGYGVGHTTAAGYGGFGSGHNGTYGKTYGLVLTPIHPGSPSGDYQGGHPGGGLIRIHAAGKVEIAGRLDASARESDTSASSASGGGIWVTAGGRMTVLPGAVLKARGGYRCTGAGGPGGGGRIALAQMLSSAQLAAMMADEQYHGPGKANTHVFEEEVFKASHPGVGIDVLGGEDSAGEQKGSFRFVDGQSIGLMLIVR